MNEIKFYCPECRQKIGVEAENCGRECDCPVCKSTLVIPRSSTHPVQIVRRNRVEGIGVKPSRYPESPDETMRLKSLSEMAADNQLKSLPKVFSQVQAEGGISKPPMDLTPPPPPAVPRQPTVVPSVPASVPAVTNASTQRMSGEALNKLRTELKSVEHQNQWFRTELDASALELARTRAECERLRQRVAELEVLMENQKLDQLGVSTRKFVP